MSEKIATVIIPTYNERKNVQKLIPQLLNDVFTKIPDWRMKVLIVDGNSPDKTYEVVQALMKTYSDLDLIIEEKKDGIGSAYIKGFRHAMEKHNADVCIEFDGDLQHPPEAIIDLLTEIDKGYDCVLGSRRVRGGSYPKGWDLKRLFFSRVGGFLVRLILFFPFREFFKITDPTTGLRATRVNHIFRSINLSDITVKSFGYKIMFLYYLVVRGARIKEVPLRFALRSSGESKITTQTPSEIFSIALALRFADKKTRRFIKFALVGTSGLIINSVMLEIFAHSSFIEKIINVVIPYAHAHQSLEILTIKSAWAAGLAAECAIISNFICNNLWTFAASRITGFSKILATFLVFNSTSIGAVIIEYATVGIACLFFGETTLVRQLALYGSIFCLVTPYNWLIYNAIIWKRNKLTTNHPSA